MMPPLPPQPKIAIACGGTGGHLFPGLAVAHALAARHSQVCLIISQKEVDRDAVRGLRGFRILELPAVGLVAGERLAFLRGFGASLLKSRRYFAQFRPHAVLAMGGFTSAAPVLAGRMCGAGAFLHESNSVPGKANRWLSRFASTSFTGFPAAGKQLRSRKVMAIGTPVREEFFSLDAGSCRRALNFDPALPVVLVTGGSQGAEGVNRIILASLAKLTQALPRCQWLHLTGAGKAEGIRQAYRAAGMTAQVHEFMSRMGLALGAATVAISRAGASSLAELAAADLPSILVPYPSAADNHQYYNALAYADAGAAFLLEQHSADPERLVTMLRTLALNQPERERMQVNLRRWQAPLAADEIARAILKERGFDELAAAPRKSAGGPPDEHNQKAQCEALFASEPGIYRVEVAS